ncbi:MAG: hypothetical protein IPP77_00955 [Bacteroidetes bacterium]|nr:hypothetical protein [Bacteroidota bacterium]
MMAEVARIDEAAWIEPASPGVSAGDIGESPAAAQMKKYWRLDSAIPKAMGMRLFCFYKD